MTRMFNSRRERDLEITRNGGHAWHGTRCMRFYEERHSETVSLRCPGAPSILIDNGEVSAPRAAPIVPSIEAMREEAGRGGV